MTFNKDKPNLSDWQKAYNDICGIAILGSILSGTLGLLGGAFIATQNCQSKQHSIEEKMSISHSEFDKYLQSSSHNVNSSRTNFKNSDTFSF